MKRGKGELKVAGPFFVQGLFWLLLTEWLVFRIRDNFVGSGGTDTYAGTIVVAAFLLSLLLTLVLFRAKIGLKVYGVMVYFALIFGAYVYGLYWLSFPFAFLVMPLVALVLFFSPRVFWQNFVMAIALAGIAMQFAQALTFSSASFLLVLLSIYDIVAVSITHHMVRLAKTVIEFHVPVIFILPLRAKDLFLHVNSFRASSFAVFMGAGDVVMPTLLIAVAPTAQVALGAMGGSAVGFAVLAGIFARYKQPLPALPFLTTGAIIGALLMVRI